MSREILIDAIKEAGGIQAVADRVGKTHEAVRKWTKKGLPRTEWTGETRYAETIASMQDKYSASQILVRKAAA